MNTPELRSVDDPRGVLEKYSRKELEYLARFEGVQELDPAMPVDLMRDIFRRKPPRQWPRPMLASIGTFAGRRVTPPYDQWINRAFGQQSAMPLPEIKEVNALDVLREDWEQQKIQPVTPKTTSDRNSEIYRLSLEGESNVKIAEKYNISSARVSQIVNRAKRQNGKNSS